MSLQCEIPHFTAGFSELDPHRTMHMRDLLRGSVRLAEVASSCGRVSIYATRCHLPRRGERRSSARVLGVESFYPVDGYGEAVLNAEIVEALRDDTTRAIARESARLRNRQRNLVLGIVWQFEEPGRAKRPIAGRLLG